MINHHFFDAGYFKKKMPEDLKSRQTIAYIPQHGSAIVDPFGDAALARPVGLGMGGISRLPMSIVAIDSQWKPLAPFALKVAANNAGPAISC